ncbi:MAG: hypothetical protein CL927_08525, partial [Deltaproteobacteria bacterium]|nr:hypothetical protein [Deltaproteobacteria bacterium]
MLNPGDTIERYEVVRTIGIGGHATVYLLKHRTLGSEHALKVVNLHRPDLRARLLQEGRIQANLQHPNIVPVTDVLEVGGLQALLMPFVDGPDLQLWLEQNHPVPIAMAVQLFREIVDAVGFAHDQGLVHRDLKPANILMNRQSDRWRPHITDFGIAKITGNQGGAGTRSGIGMGTPAYMAPEQVQNAAHVDHRADIFALGCILYEFISGTRLFSAPNPLAIAADIAGPVPIDLSAIHEGVAPSVRAVLNGCLEKDRERRFPDCGVILRALEDVDVAAIISPSIRKTSAQASSRTVEAAPTPAVPLETPLAPLETPAQPLAPSGDQAPATGPALQATQSGPATPALDASHRSRRSTLPTPLPLQPPPKPSSAWLFGLAGMLATLAVGWFVLDAFTPPTSSSGVTTRPVPP